MDANLFDRMAREIGFVHTYSREKIFTADGVRKQLLETIENLPESFDVVLKSDLHAIHEQFADLIIRRNALVHAHPITDEDGSQISGYQAHTSKPIPDIDWRKGDIEALIQDIDVAATGNLSRAFEALRPKPN